MKIALIYLGRRGGGPVYSLEISRKLREKAEVFCVISRQMENVSVWQKDIKNLYQVDTYTNKKEFFLSFFDLPRFSRLKKKIQEFSPDVIYYPFFHFWLPLINLWFPKIPKVYTCHDPILHSGEDNALMRWLQDLLIRQSQRVIILSSVFKDVISNKGIVPEKIDVIPHGIFDYYSAAAEVEKNHGVQACQKPPVASMDDRSYSQRPPTLLFFGRILEYKGLDILLKSWPIIKEKAPKARLLIVGGGDLKPYQELLAGQRDIIIENKWINDNEVAGYFQQADVMACPYREASQSGAIPVAYVFKMPVVASKTGGLIDQVDHQKTGFLVEPGNIEELADACVKLLKDEGLRKEMGESGYQKATTEWSWENIGDKVLRSLEIAARS